MRAVHGARPYWFEVFTLLNIAALELALRRIGMSALPMLLRATYVLGAPLVAELAVGILIRYAISPAYRAVIRERAWWLDTARLLVFSVLLTNTYGTLKLMIPLLHPRLFDQQLWNADRVLLFGASPNLFFLNLFSNPFALRTIDWTYANVFVASILVAPAFFLSAPERDVRIPFMNANTTMWLAGAWLYLALPTLGPAYRFPDVWLPLASWLPQTQLLQRRLMTNYQNVLHLAQQPRPVSILLGIAAFPSMHVAFETLAFLHVRKVLFSGKIGYGIAFILIFIGSVVTGWHYLIDSLAGIVLAVACNAAFQWLPERFRRHATAD